MKTSPAVLLAISAASTALAMPTEISATSNTTATTSAGVNNTSIGLLETYYCVPTTNYREWIQWYYNSKSNGPHLCAQINDNNEWYMINAYRSGGTQGVHWKYTNDVNDSVCLKDWKYYASNGQDLIGTISGRTTLVNESRRWCALPVYRPGGVKGKQWEHCTCAWFGNDRE